jgi:blocked-early-in-transport protein 1
LTETARRLEMIDAAKTKIARLPCPTPIGESTYLIFTKLYFYLSLHLCVPLPNTEPVAKCQTGNSTFQTSRYSPTASPSPTNKPTPRFGRDSRNSLFSTYDQTRSTSPSKTKSSKSPRATASPSYGYGYTASQPSPSYSPSYDQQHNHNLSSNPGPAFSAYPGASSSSSTLDAGQAGFRAATPNSRGQYSSSVLDELESQNDEHVGILTGKVKELKNVCFHIHSPFPNSRVIERSKKGGEG